MSLFKLDEKEIFFYERGFYMTEHPIQGLMVTAMNSIQDMVDVNTIIGEPIETTNNVVIIPISKVTFGFAAGGSEFKGETIDEYSKKEKEEAIQYRLPFGGGSGAGVNISPVAFLVIQENNIRLLPVNYTSAIDKLLDYVPDLMDKVNCVINRTMTDKQEELKRKYEKEEREFNSKENLNKKIREEIELKNTDEDIEENLNEKEEKIKTPRRIKKNQEIEYDETDL